MGRLPFWVIIGLFSGAVLAGFLAGEWHRLTSPDDPIQREFWTVYALLLGVLPAYFFGRAVLTVAAELRRRRSRSNLP